MHGRRSVSRWLLGLVVCCIAALALALPSTAAVLSGQYTATTALTHVNYNTWTFQYTITNVNQSQGLDAFVVQVPTTATLSNIVVPVSPQVLGTGGYWATSLGNAPTGGYDSGGAGTPSAGYEWLWFFGYNLGSLFPAGDTATLSFTAAGVSPGTGTSTLVTYTPSATYANFTTSLSAPTVYTPEPASGWMLLGILGALTVSVRRGEERRRSSFQHVLR